MQTSTALEERELSSKSPPVTPDQSHEAGPPSEDADKTSVATSSGNVIDITSSDDNVPSKSPEKALSSSTKQTEAELSSTETLWPTTKHDRETEAQSYAEAEERSVSSQSNEPPSVRRDDTQRTDTKPAKLNFKSFGLKPSKPARRQLLYVDDSVPSSQAGRDQRPKFTVSGSHAPLTASSPPKARSSPDGINLPGKKSREGSELDRKGHSYLHQLRKRPICLPGEESGTPSKKPKIGDSEHEKSADHAEDPAVAYDVDNFTKRIPPSEDSKTS
jgi:hypothetical protein